MNKKNWVIKKSVLFFLLPNSLAFFGINKVFDALIPGILCESIGSEKDFVSDIHRINGFKVFYHFLFLFLFIHASALHQLVSELALDSWLIMTRCGIRGGTHADIEDVYKCDEER